MENATFDRLGKKGGKGEEEGKQGVIASRKKGKKKKEKNVDKPKPKTDVRRTVHGQRRKNCSNGRGRKKGKKKKKRPGRGTCRNKVAVRGKKKNVVDSRSVGEEKGKGKTQGSGAKNDAVEKFDNSDVLAPKEGRGRKEMADKPTLKKLRKSDTRPRDVRGPVRLSGGGKKNGKKKRKKKERLPRTRLSWSPASVWDRRGEGGEEKEKGLP